jgi:hypothetical protein
LPAVGDHRGGTPYAPAACWPWPAPASRRVTPTHTAARGAEEPEWHQRVHGAGDHQAAAGDQPPAAAERAAAVRRAAQGRDAAPHPGAAG